MKDYKESYERERKKNKELAEEIARLTEANEELTFKLARIRNNPVWKLSKPLRSAWHFVGRQKQRVTNQGSVRGVLSRMKYKRHEKKAQLSYGKASFPTEEVCAAQRERVFERPVMFSILTPLYNTPERFLRDMIESVLLQTYSNWELCLADGSDADHAYVGDFVRAYMQQPEALREDGSCKIVYHKLEENKGISENTNACLALANGEYIGLLDHDDILHPEVLYLYTEAVNEEGADYLYCDETTFGGNSIDHMLTMHFKPDYAIDNLRANNYICHFSVFDRTLLEGDDLFRPQFDGSQDHDMILRLTDRAQKIVHIPRLLYYWRSHTGSTAAGIGAKEYAIEAARGAVADHLTRHGFSHFRITSTRAFETIFKISYEIGGDPLVSIVIPTKDHREDLTRCVRSVLEKTSYPNFEIVLVENGSEKDETFHFYEELANGPDRDRIRIFDFYGQGGARKFLGEAGENLGEDGKDADGKYPPFNYSAVVNFGVSQADGEYIILLNNDVEVLTVNWIEELLMYAQREDVGAVGAKLYFPDRHIQHAGVVLGLGAHRTAGHSHYGMPKENLGYMGRLCYAQDVSAVTAACMMVSRARFDEAEGFDTGFAVSLNDVDFCLRLREKGYLNIFTPFAELNHYESASRGTDLAGKNAARYEAESAHFREKWKEVLDAGDPYYNPNFTLDRSDFSLK